jgi:non-ribosomal peptide synthase protein (TIGR01720 family)
VCSTMAGERAVRAAVEAGRAMLPIGSAMSGRRVYLLDQWQQGVPIGVRGELHVGGKAVARGYLHRAELTAERFIPDPYSSQPGARLYRTGDLARYLPDGQLEYLGRADQQVKIRGYRIELGEIETALLSHQSVREAIVIAHEDEASGKRLIAYLTVETDRPTPSTAELRQHLQQTLPDYMLPSAFILLDHLPLTPNGKVDRRALPAFGESERLESGTGYEPPQTLAEQLLAAIWMDLLGLSQVSRTDNFFSLGGDSILTIQVVARAQQAGLLLTSKHLFQHQTLSALAAIAQHGTGDSHAEQGVVRGVVPLTPIQGWFFSQEWERAEHYNQSVLVVARRELEVEQLRGAVRRVLEHHDALRMRYRRGEGGGEWEQENAGMEVLDEESMGRVVRQVWLEQAASAGADSNRKSAESAENAESAESRGEVEPLEADAAAQLLHHAQLLQADFDLSVPPLMRVALFEAGQPYRQRLLIIIHHLVTDGVSWRILLEDLQAAYEQLERGQAEGEVRLPAKTVSYKEWAERQARWVREVGVGEAEAGYWREQARVEVGRLAEEREGGENREESRENREESARQVVVEMSEEETQRLLREVGRWYEAEMWEVMLSAVVGAVREWSGESAMRVEVEGHGREMMDEVGESNDGGGVERTVGWFTRAYPLVVRLEGGSRRRSEERDSDEREAQERAEEARAMVRQVRKQVRGVPGGGRGYGVLRYMKGGIEEAGAEEEQWEAEAQIGFNYLGQFDQVFAGTKMFALASEESGFERSGGERRPHLLDINGSVVDGRLRVNWIYSENIYLRSTIERLAESFAEKLRELIAFSGPDMTGTYAPSDFAEFDWGQDELDSIMTAIKGSQ